MGWCRYANQAFDHWFFLPSGNASGEFADAPLPGLIRSPTQLTFNWRENESIDNLVKRWSPQCGDVVGLFIVNDSGDVYLFSLDWVSANG